MQRGFTLIETVIYLALFAIIVGGLIIAAYGLFENSGRNQTKSMLQDEQNFVLNKILFSLESANSVSAPASGASGSALTFTTYGGSTVTVALSGTNVIWNGGVLPLNNSNVSVTQLTFTHAGNSTNPESIKIDMTVSTKAPSGQTITQIASATRYIRK